MTIAQTSIKQTVSARYSGIAERLLQQEAQGLSLELLPQASRASCCGPDSSCCSPESAELDVSQALSLYTPEEIRDLPAEIVGATLGCGNPMAIASLQAGESVL